MTAEEKLEVYRGFFLQLDKWLRSGEVVIEPCKCLCEVQMQRLINEASNTKDGYEIDGVGSPIWLVKTELEELND